jgi:hypothetical protein
MKNAWYAFRKNTGLSFAQCLKNAWTNLKIEVLQVYVEGCKMFGAKFDLYKNEAFAINSLKKNIVRPSVVDNATETEFVLDFVMFN